MDDNTVQNEMTVARRGAAKPMLWVGMISIAMFFAGLTSAYVISKNREDWVKFEFPDSLYWSTIAIVLSSVFLFYSERLLKKSNLSLSRVMLFVSVALGFVFTYFQYAAFFELLADGHYPSGEGSSVSAAFLFVIAIAHILHLLGGVIVMMVVIYNHFKKRYTSTETLGFELGAIYWHFVDLIWLFLFFFFYFLR